MRQTCGHKKPGNTFRPVNLITIGLAATLLISCGGGSSNSASTPAAISATTSTLCSRITGASALYWDFSLGVLGLAYPPESTLPPTPFGGVFLHPRISLSFQYPAGWSATAIIDSFTVSNEPATVLQGNLTVLSGASVVRDDGRALWRHLHTTEAFPGTAADRLNFEIQRAIDGFGIAATPTEICRLSGAGSVGGFPGTTSASFVRAGDFTILAVVSAAQVPLIGQSTSLVATVSVAPTAEFDTLILNTYLPISWQLISKGGRLNQCEDGVDNDGDGLVDLADPGCSSAEDDSELG